MKIKKDELIFLFGAGITADAGIPTSTQMINDVENNLIERDEWKKFKELYYLIKSGVNFSYGIQGKETIFNIEVLINTLNELEKKEMHPLYPFIGSWNIKFNEVIGNNFVLIEEFRKKLVGQLKGWMIPNDIRKSEYLQKIQTFKKDFNFPLRIFTLNYDKLLEQNLTDLKIERGFDENRQWDFKRFYELPEEPDIYLYKLHGSIDWQRDPNTQIVSFIDSIPDEPDLIFGTQYKMQYIDPYLFIMSEFRYYCLKARLIVCIGYSFYDEHINGILQQALNSNENLKICIFAYNDKDEKQLNNVFREKTQRLDIISKKSAKDVLNYDFKIDFFENKIIDYDTKFDTLNNKF